MRHALGLFALAFGCTIGFPALAQQLLGSGSTFVYPVMAKWSAAYEKISGVHVAYQPIGSSGGITEIKSGVVDFGASDAPLLPDQLAHDGLAQFPVVIGAIVPVVNLDGVAPGQLRFTGPLLADIYLGKVKNWSDPAIAAVNAGIKFPDRAITVIHRSDGSGTTFNWVDYLSKVSGEWKTEVGANTSVAWPVGLGGKGNSGLADDVIRQGFDRLCRIRLCTTEKAGLRTCAKRRRQLRRAGRRQFRGGDRGRGLGKDPGLLCPVE